MASFGQTTDSGNPSHVDTELILFKCGTCSATYRSHELCTAHVLDTHKFSTTIRHRGIKRTDDQYAVFKDIDEAQNITRLRAVPVKAERTEDKGIEVGDDETVALSCTEPGEASSPRDVSIVVMCNLCNTAFTSETVCLNHIKQKHERIQALGRENITALRGSPPTEGISGTSLNQEVGDDDDRDPEGNDTKDDHDPLLTVPGPPQEEEDPSMSRKPLTEALEEIILDDTTETSEVVGCKSIPRKITIQYCGDSEDKDVMVQEAPAAVFTMCDLCDATFSSDSDFLKHLEEQHSVSSTHNVNAISRHTVDLPLTQEALSFIDTPPQPSESRGDLKESSDQDGMEAKSSTENSLIDNSRMTENGEFTQNRNLPMEDISASSGNIESDIQAGQEAEHKKKKTDCAESSAPVHIEDQMLDQEMSGDAPSPRQKQKLTCFSCGLKYPDLDAVGHHINTDHARDFAEVFLTSSLPMSELTRNMQYGEDPCRTLRKKSRKRAGTADVAAAAVCCSVCGKSKTSVKSCRKHILRAHGETKQKTSKENVLAGSKSPVEKMENSGSLDGMLDLSKDILDNWKSLLQESDSSDIADKNCSGYKEDGGRTDILKGAKLRLLNDTQVKELSKGAMTYRCSLCSQEFQRRQSCVTHLKRVHADDWSKSSGSQCDLMLTIESEQDEGGMIGRKHVIIVCEEGKQASGQRKSTATKRKFSASSKSQSAVESEDFRCNVCQQWCRSKEVLEGHIGQKHCGVSGITCRKCIQAANTKKKGKMSELVSLVSKVRDQRLNGIKPLRGTTDIPIYLVCLLCEDVFGVKSHLAAHVSRSHHEFVCTHCKVDFPSYQSLHEHMHVHNCGPLWCSECPQTFYATRLLLNHMFTHKQRHRCNHCNMVFGTKGNLNRHIKGQHPRKKKLQGYYKCKQCDRTFRFIFHFQKHMKEEHSIDIELPPSLKFVCDVCGKVLPSRGRFVTHMRSHTAPDTTEEKKLQKSALCHKCGKVFDCHSKLRRHSCPAEKSGKSGNKASIKKGIKGFECSTCSAKFAREASLNAHLAKVKEAMHACTECCKTFPSEPHLQRHNFFWHSRKTISCEKCNKRFSLSRTLQLHMAFAHKEDKKVRATEYVKCDDCGCSFISKSQREAHKCVPRFKRRVVPPCKLCGTQFPTLVELASHTCLSQPAVKIVKKMPQVINKVSLSCHLCGDKFSDANQLAFHKCKARQEAKAPCKIALPKDSLGGKKIVQEKGSKSTLESLASKFGTSIAFPHCQDCDQWFLSNDQKEKHKCARKKSVVKKKSPVKRAKTPQQGQQRVRTQCPKCENNFRNAAQLASHTCPNGGGAKQATSRVKSKREQSQVYIQCEKCSYKFPDAAKLATHTCIYKEETHSCSNCQDIFASRIELMIHAAQAHDANVSFTSSSGNY